MTAPTLPEPLNQAWNEIVQLPTIHIMIPVYGSKENLVKHTTAVELDKVEEILRKYLLKGTDEY